MGHFRNQTVLTSHPACLGGVSGGQPRRAVLAELAGGIQAVVIQRCSSFP